MTDLLAAALDYVSLAGAFRVLPLHTPLPDGCSCGREACGSPGKHPRTPRGVYDATTEEDVIRAWWARWPDANVGIATGDGLVVLDVDPRNGGDASLAALEAEYGRIETYTVRTGGGGRHLYLSGDLPARNAFRPGLDLKADGGYVVAPPSLHASGALYEVARGGEIAESPDWLAELTVPSARTSGSTDSDPQIPEGERNSRLTSLAGALRRQGLSEGEILAALEAINAERCDPPLPEAEVDQIAGSISRYQPDEALGPIVDPPTRPMGVARWLLDRDFRDEDGRLLLRAWRGDLFEHDGTAWPEVEAAKVRKIAYEALEHALFRRQTPSGIQLERWDPTSAKVTRVLDALQAIVLTDAEELPVWTDGRTEPDAVEVVAMSNGLLHLPSRSLQAHTPAFFNRYALPFAYDATAPRPERWLAFLRELWPDDPESIETLQDALGYVIGGDTSLQKIIIIIGPKRAGKGTIGRVLTGLLGQQNVAAPTLAGLGSHFGLQDLIGKPLALVSDARLSGRGSVIVERLLSISGEDALTVDRKYKQPWTGRLPTRFMVLTNEVPRLTDASVALASRFIPLVLTRSFFGKEDPGLTDKLLAEAPGIFAWALEGLDRLAERGHFLIPETAREAMIQLEDLASPVAAFVRDRCVLHPVAQVPVQVLWEAWRAWCEDEGRLPGTKALFGRNLSAAFPTIRRVRPSREGERVYFYEGIGLDDRGGSGPGGPGVVPGGGPSRSPQEDGSGPGGPSAGAAEGGSGINHRLLRRKRRERDRDQ